MHPLCEHFHVCHTCAVDLEVFDGRLCRKRHGDRVELIWCSFDEMRWTFILNIECTQLTG